MRAPDFGLGFEPASERLTGEEAERAALVAKEIPYRVKFLDDALGGILPHDLVLIGSTTGAGKTALASMIAENAAAAGKRVHYFALEAEPREIERRIKYRCVAHYLESRSFMAGLVQCTYRNWYRGKLRPFIDYEANAEIEAAIAVRYKTLHTYYRGTDFGTADLERLFLAVQEQTDLIILDHLHYVDIDDAVSENAAQKRLVKRVRDLSLGMGKPIILVAHLRKKQGGRVHRVVPELDDFMGSSDITKIVTQVILLARASQENTQPFLWPTYVQVAKDRMDGVRPYVALMLFNERNGRYDDSYTLGRLSFAGDEWKELPEKERPRWARAEARSCRAKEDE